VGLLGRGGMGEVYRADDLKLGQSVALKFIARSMPQTGPVLARFNQEVRLARQVTHPNVCRVFDIIETEGRPFIAMEYIDGEDLSSLLRRIGRLPSDKALEVARQLLAGLAAIHEQGAVHCDLKPANVMLDGRGRVRITDFGLADLTGKDGQGAGTPAYMAPEQIANQALTPRSDIYSLGLVLYEIFTGKQAFAPTRIGERQHPSDDWPTPPSQIVKDLDPHIEQVIVRCLEKDPLKRPASAQQLARALPGGDPLTAALEAGETPSPEMLVAADDNGLLSGSAAFMFICLTVIFIGMTFFLARYGSEVGLAHLEVSPEELEVRARDIVRHLGYSDHPQDSSSWLERDDEYLAYQAFHEPSTRWYRFLETDAFGPITLWYRQSPRLLIPLNGDYFVKKTDPPLDVSGMVSVRVTSQGRLLDLLAIPSRMGETTGTVAKFGWQSLFEAAGFNESRFAVAVPKQLPPVPFDERSEWDGRSDSGTPIHITAAALNGKPVYFEVAGPWSHTTEKGIAPLENPFAGSVTNAETFFVNSVTVLIVLSVFITGAIFARRNIRVGRGDRKGAFQLSALTFLLTLLLWIFRGHFVLDISSTYLMLSRTLGEALLLGSLVWLSYMALEPNVRRLWPRCLISWARLSSSKFRDPLVARDVLAGSMIGALVGALNYVETFLPYCFNIRGITPSQVSLELLSDPRHFSGALVSALQQAVLRALLFPTLLFLTRLVVRRNWLAITVTAVVLIASSLTPGNVLVDLPITDAQMALLIFVLMRFGLIALFIASFLNLLIAIAPITLRISDWYAGRSILIFLLILTIALYGFRTSQSRRPLSRN
jgi:serine/threonine protein kinase